MYNTKVLLSVAALTGASMAQTSTVFPDPACSSSIFALVAAAPTTPPELESAFSALASGAGTESLDLLVRPSAYVDQLCSYVSELPESILPVFASWGADLLNFASTEIDSYDGIVTKCVTTGTAASSITSFIHSIASNPAELCKESSSTPSNGTASITSYPTPTGNGTTPSASSSTLIPTGAAARPTGVLAGAAAVGGVLGVVALL